MKRISPGTVTVAVLAIVVGLVAAYVARHAVEKPMPESGLAVVVARVNLTANHRVRAEDLKVIEVPREQVPDGAMAAAEIVLGRVVRSTIVAGQPVLDSELYPVGVTPNLSEMIPAGERAVTITVQGSTPGAAIVADSLIDIALTVEDDHPDLGGLATKTLLRRVHVLAGPDTTARGTGNSLVVSVTPQQANTLITAQRTGTLSVTLCATDDVAGPANDEFIGRNDLLGLAPPIEPRRHTIERWSGGQMELIEISENQVVESRQATAYDTLRFQPLAVQPTPLPEGDAPQTEAAHDNN